MNLLRAAVILLLLGLLTGCAGKKEPVAATMEYTDAVGTVELMDRRDMIMGVGTQGTAAYGDYVVQLAHGGLARMLHRQENGSFALEGTFELASAADTNHCNQTMFGPEKFDENDPLPLLFVTTSHGGGMDKNGYKGHCSVERLLYDEQSKRWSSELVYSIYFNDRAYTGAKPANSYTPSIPFENGKYTYYSTEDFANAEGYEKVAWGAPAYFVDSAPTEATEGKFFMFSARFRTKPEFEAQFQTDGLIDSYARDNAYIITQFDMPELPKSVDDPNYGGSITLTPKDITDQFTTEYDIYITQGGTMYQGRIYYSYGFGGEDDYSYPALRVFDVAERAIVAKTDLRGTDMLPMEPECCFIMDGALHLNLNDWTTQKAHIYRFSYIESLAVTDKAGAYTYDCITGARLREIKAQ